MATSGVGARVFWDNTTGMAGGKEREKRRPSAIGYQLLLKIEYFTTKTQRAQRRKLLLFQ
jgi:hypothetical protein